MVFIVPVDSVDESTSNSGKNELLVGGKPANESGKTWGTNSMFVPKHKLPGKVPAEK
jgi:hypothetical protein